MASLQAYKLGGPGLDVRHRREGVQGLHDGVGLDDLVSRCAALGLAVAALP